MRLTQAEFERLQSKGKPDFGQSIVYDYPMAPPKTRGPNKTEAAYGDYLELLRRHGDVDWFRFEAIKLKLANGTWYKPDYPVIVRGELQLHEVKGFMREAARVRLNVAAAQFPWRFFLVRHQNGHWVTSEVAK